MTASCLVVNADDLGVARGATLGIVKAHRDGIVTSASLATTTPFYDHAVEECVRNCPELGIGLHFTLTSGRPVSPVWQVPMLTDERGYFRWRFMPLLAATVAPGGERLLDQVECELEAQLGRLREDGICPDHINGERHVHLIPGVFDRVVAVAQRHGIGTVRVGRDCGPELLAVRQWPAVVLNGGMVKSWLLSRLSSRNRRRLPASVGTPERVASYLYTGRVDLFLEELLSEPKAGVTEVMVHPGIPEESAGLELGNRELERYLASEDRRTELDAVTAARSRVGAWQLTTYGRIARDRPSC